MTIRTIRWTTGGGAAVSIALIAGAVALSYVDRHLVPASGWDFPDVLEEVTFMAVPAGEGDLRRAAGGRRGRRICLEASHGSLGLTVADDGTGYDTGSTPMGSGQRNMADRLAVLGGRLEVRSAPGQGTILTAHLPLPSVPLPS